MQGEEKGVGSLKNPDQRKVVGKVISIQITTSLPTLMSTTLTTRTSKPLTKGKGIVKDFSEEGKKEEC